MEIANQDSAIFFAALKRIEVSFQYEGPIVGKDGIYISLLYNEITTEADFHIFLIALFENTKKEIINNLHLITGLKEREDYLKLLWFTYIELEKDIMRVSELFNEGGLLSGNLEQWEWGLEGQVIADRHVKVILPENAEFEILSEEKLLVDCFSAQYDFCFLYMNFVFALCENQKVNIEFPKENVIDFVRKQSTKPLPISSTIKKVKWSGTPGEFGAIFNKLIDNGFIEVVKDKANMVRVLNEIFEVKNENSAPVNEKYLYKCFGEKEKSYNPGEFKIPQSDNYHKK